MVEIVRLDAGLDESAHERGERFDVVVYTAQQDGLA